MIDYNHKSRIVRVQRGTYDYGMKLIYEWVKTGVITFREYVGLCDANRNSVY